MSGAVRAWNLRLWTTCSALRADTCAAFTQPRSNSGQERGGRLRIVPQPQPLSVLRCGCCSAAAGPLEPAVHTAVGARFSWVGYWQLGSSSGHQSIPRPPPWSWTVNKRCDLPVVVTINVSVGCLWLCAACPCRLRSPRARASSHAQHIAHDIISHCTLLTASAHASLIDCRALSSFQLPPPCAPSSSSLSHSAWASSPCPSTALSPMLPLMLTVCPMRPSAPRFPPLVPTRPR